MNHQTEPVLLDGTPGHARTELVAFHRPDWGPDWMVDIVAYNDNGLGCELNPDMRAPTSAEALELGRNWWIAHFQHFQPRQVPA